MKNHRVLIKSLRGFTLIELLVVIAILTILLAITLIAINPQAQFRKANDSKRRSDVNAILNAVSQWSADNGGNLIAGSATPLLDAQLTPVLTPIEIATNKIDLCSLLAPNYIAMLPVDPGKGPTPGISDCTASYSTGYGIAVSNAANSRVTVWGLSATPPFSVAR